MALLTRGILRNPRKFKVEKVTLMDGDIVFVREMTATAKDAFESSLMKPVLNEKEELVKFEREYTNFRAKLAVATICDERGVLIFKPEDVEPLGVAIGAIDMDRIIEKSQEINSISKQMQEEIVKNSLGAKSASSTSDSVSG